jgi:hypothetical protein
MAIEKYVLHPMLLRGDGQGSLVKIKLAKRCRTEAMTVQFGLQKKGKFG